MAYLLHARDARHFLRWLGWGFLALGDGGWGAKHRAGGNASAPAFSIKVALSGLVVADEGLMRAAIQVIIGWGLAVSPLSSRRCGPLPRWKGARVAALPVCFGTRGGVAGGAAVATK